MVRPPAGTRLARRLRRTCRDPGSYAISLLTGKLHERAAFLIVVKFAFTWKHTEEPKQ